ncbi:ScbR family autoregulator-binding transcription factor [Streptomyces sp. TRM 70361]|uniref:ScbR family autoregulator-binding transcription factor n=1 Tax=Streptomyces sp. TRM 70361 TaxID=3116553 RepID=UPI002E7B6852|nr:ScbR family autoregulator-binding transcription factor [Streptomyces sp. TRM 70361]MEE1941975.1 ScbR family autoregulator-binding transcription factor [Streptomyces sp. TRM 70361]
MAKQERSERTMERLVAAAAQEFAAQGFMGTSLADVSASAGVTKGALFFHFPTKDQLADAVLSGGQDVLETTLEELRGQESCFLQTVIDATHVLNRLLRDDPFIKASVRITRERAQDRPAPLDFYPLWLGRLWQLLDSARRHGELGPSVTDSAARNLITAVVSGAETLTWMRVSREETEQWLSHLWELTLPLLCSETSGSRIRTTAPVVVVPTAARGY